MQTIKYADINDGDAVAAIRDFLLNHTDTGIFLLPRFLKAVCRSYGFKYFYVLAYSEESICGVASCYIRPGLIKRGSLQSVPGGFWAKDEDSERTLLDELGRIVEENRLDGFSLNDLYQPVLSLDKPYIVHRAVRELPKDSEKLLSLYSSNLRRKINKAKKEGLCVEQSNDINIFYGIWSRNMRDLGTPAVGVEFFRNMHEQLKKYMTLLVVKKGCDTIGAAIVLGYRNTAFDPYISCLRDCFKFYPNNLLYHEMLCRAIEKGFEYFDLGRSQAGSGNEQFKLQYGAELEPVYSYGSGKGGYKSILRKYVEMS